MTDDDDAAAPPPPTEATLLPDGIMPKEALLAVMRHHVGRYEFLSENRPKAPDKPLAELHASNRGRYLKRMADWEESVNAVLGKIREAAKDAAPYYHGKLAPVTVLSAEDIGRIDLDALTDEQLGILLRRVARALGINDHPRDGPERLAAPPRADSDEDRGEGAAAEKPV